MDRKEFMSKAHEAVQSFEARWNRGQHGVKPDDWPDHLHEEDWWEQLICHIEDEAFKSND